MINSVHALGGLDESNFGRLSSLTVKEIGVGSKFLHFENSTRSETQTMVVCVQNESFTPEIEVFPLFLTTLNRNFFILKKNRIFSK